MIVRFGHIHYDLHEDGTACVCGYEKELQGEVKIPSYGVYKGKRYRVTSIGEMAFSECTGITSITIPNTIVIIEYCAFDGCTGLTEINIPNSVTIIEDCAFFGCTRLTEITMFNSVTSIGQHVFYNCIGLTAITLPNSITSIEDGAFEGCIGLSEINIPNSVTNIGNHAFEDCTGLKKINIPKSVMSIGECAFQGCTGLSAITIPNSVTSIGNDAFLNCTRIANIQVNKGNPTYDSREKCNAIIDTATNSLTTGCYTTIIPNSVTSIKWGAFLGCIGLTAITIPNSVKSIGNEAFSRCTGLTSIKIPNSVTSIGSSAFYSCTGLTSITIPNSVTSIGSGAFHDCKRLSAITIPNSVTSIGEEAFRGCIGLTAITIPHNVTNIKNFTFNDCIGLTKINIPNSVTSIGSGAFDNCIGITAITIPNSVTNIGDHAFYNCIGLTAITIPNNVTSIGHHTFYDCKGLTSITLGNGIQSIEAKVFDGCENLQIIRVPKGKKEDYCRLGLEPYRELIQEPQEEEYSILLNIARGYERGIGMAKNLAQAVLCYVQAADKGCSEAAFHLGELYETGNGLPQDLKQAAEWYAKAAALYHPSAETKRRACLQKLEQEEQRMEAYQREQAQERVNRVAESAKAKYLFFDTETNGLPYNYKAGIENTSNWPRLLQIGWIMTDERGNVLKSCTKWIFPDGFSVDSEVTKLTGITTDKLLFEGERISSVLSDFMQDIESAEILVGHNVEYDIMVVGCELYRNGQPMQGQALTRHPHICTMKRTVDFCAIPSTNSYYSDYKYPKLTELYTKLFGHAFSGAHDAMADIKATKECFFELKRRGII